MRNNFRYAVRGLLRAPGFTIAAVLTLALGIGANTSIFSVVDALLLRPLPYPDSGRLVMVWDQLARYNLPRRSPEYHTADAYRRLDVFESTGGIFWYDETQPTDHGAERVSIMTVSKEVFPMLGPRAEKGRIFLPEEYRRGADPVVILGHSLFLRRFGGDPSVIGKSIRFRQTSRRIVGVLSADFDFTLRAGAVDFWIPVPLDTRASWGNATRMIARLKPGVSLETAQAALSVAAKHVDETEHPYAGPNGEDAGYSVKVVTLHEQFLGEFRSVTLILLCAVAAVLLIACVNVGPHRPVRLRPGILARRESLRRSPGTRRRRRPAGPLRGNSGAVRSEAGIHQRTRRYDRHRPHRPPHRKLTRLSTSPAKPRTPHRPHKDPHTPSRSSSSPIPACPYTSA